MTTEPEPMSDEDVAWFFDRFEALNGTASGMRIGALAAASETGQRFLREAARRGIPVELA